MKKTEQVPIAQTLGVPVLSGLVGTLLLMAVGAFAVLHGKADPDQIPMLTYVCLAVGSLCASLMAARRAVRNRLVWGVSAGIGLFVCMILLSLLWLGQPVVPIRVGVNFAVNIIAAFVGGMLGASMKHKKHRKK